jgi:hypothetical protein
VDTKKGIASSEEVRNRQSAPAPAAAKEKITPPPARVYADDELVLATALINSVSSITDILQLRELWQANADLLDAPTPSGTLKDAINRHKATLDAKEA